MTFEKVVINIERDPEMNFLLFQTDLYSAVKHFLFKL